MPIAIPPQQFSIISFIVICPGLEKTHFIPFPEPNFIPLGKAYGFQTIQRFKRGV